MPGAGACVGCASSAGALSPGLQFTSNNLPVFCLGFFNCERGAMRRKLPVWKCEAFWGQCTYRGQYRAKNHASGRVSFSRVQWVSLVSQHHCLQLSSVDCTHEGVSACAGLYPYMQRMYKVGLYRRANACRFAPLQRWALRAIRGEASRASAACGWLNREAATS